MIDVEKLLEPIPGDQPAGPNVRLEPGNTLIEDIEEARRELDPALDPDGRGKDPDWPKVRRLCEAALTENTKDLQVAAHLVEALAYLEGYPGVEAGLRLVQELLERYWDGLHPGFEDGEIIPPLRARWVSWLGTSREFLTAVKSIPITSGPGVEARSWLDYEDSQRVDEAAIQSDQTAYNEMLEQGRIAGSTWQSLVAATPLERLSGLLEAVRACESVSRAVTALGDDKFGDDSPNLVELNGFFYDCREFLEERAQGAPVEGGEMSFDPDVAMVADGGAAAAPSGGGGAAGPIANRDDAYRRLREAAEYLRRTEPHSPVPYLVERAVNWGNLSFQDMLRDVLKDDKARASILETLGMDDL